MLQYSNQVREGKTLMKDLESIIREDLKELCSMPFEYVLYGKVAPDVIRIGIMLVAAIVYVVLVLLQILPFSWYLIPLTIVLLLLAYHFFYDKAYLAKFGKHLYVHRFRPFQKGIKEKVLLRNVEIDAMRSGEFHMSIALPLEGDTQYILLEPKFEKKGIAQQASNMKRLEADILKKKKK